MSTHIGSRAWINCNKCLSTDVSQRIYISSCGHLACSRCLDPSTNLYQSLETVCPVCALDTLFILITQTNDIPDEVERIISDPSKHILESIDILQSQNYERVVEGLQVKLQKYKKILEKLKDFSNESTNTLLTQENTQLRNQLARIDPNRYQATAPSTPTRLSMPQHLSSHSTPSTARSTPRPRDLQPQFQQQQQYTKPYNRPFTQSSQTPRQHSSQDNRSYQPPRTSPATQGNYSHPQNRQQPYQQATTSQGQHRQDFSRPLARASTSHTGRIPSMPLPSTPRMRDTWSEMRR